MDPDPYDSRPKPATVVKRSQLARWEYSSPSGTAASDFRRTKAESSGLLIVGIIYIMPSSAAFRRTAVLLVINIAFKGRSFNVYTL